MQVTEKKISQLRFEKKKTICNKFFFVEKFIPLIQKWKTLPKNLQHYLQLFITNDLTLEKISVMSEIQLKNLGIYNKLHLNQIKILLVHGHHETALSFSNLAHQQKQQQQQQPHATNLNFPNSNSQNYNPIKSNLLSNKKFLFHFLHWASLTAYIQFCFLPYKLK